METIGESGLPKYSSRKALRITLIYLAASIIWIFVTDRIIINFFSDKMVIELISLIKGIVFVIFTSALLFFLTQQAVNTIQHQHKELELREAKLAYLFDWASDGIFLSDKSGKYIDVNPRGCQILGYTREEIIEKNFFDIIIIEDGSPVVKFEQLRSGETRMSEQKLIKKDGSIIFAEISLRMLPNRNVQAIVRDITERKKIETELKRKDELLLDTGRTAKVGGWEFDAVTLKGNWTPEVARIHELDPEQETNVQIGMSFYEGENKKKIEQAIHEALVNGTPYDLELELITAKGNRKWIRTIGRPIKEGDKVVKVRGSIQDITERVKFETELLKSREQYRALSAHLQTVREEERTSIAREMHDELGQILTSLKMNLSLLRRQIEDKSKNIQPHEIIEEINATNSMIDKAVKRVRKLITQLRPELLDKLGLIAALEWYSQEFSNDTKIDCEFTSNTEELVLGQKKDLAIFRIVQEALTNTAKHSGASKVKISIEKNDTRVVLEIKDNGKGITEEDMKGEKSFGLLGMRERADLAQASLKILGESQKGTTTTLLINC